MLCELGKLLCEMFDLIFMHLLPFEELLDEPVQVLLGDAMFHFRVVVKWRKG